MNKDKFILAMICVVLIFGIFCGNSSSVFAQNDKDKKIVRKYCKKNFPKLKIVFLKTYDEK